MASRLIFICLLTVIPGIQTIAFGPAPGNVTGSIVGPDKKQVAAAKIVVEDGTHKWNLESDDKGMFQIDLPPGKYRFTIEKPH